MFVDNLMVGALGAQSREQPGTLLGVPGTGLW